MRLTWAARLRRTGVDAPGWKSMRRLARLVPSGQIRHDPRLVAEILQLPYPEGTPSPIGEVPPEPFVIALEGSPREDMEHPVEAQDFDDGNASRLELGKLRIAFHEEGQFLRAVLGMAGQEKPEILDWRFCHHVVEIEEEKPLSGALQYIAAMEVAVDPQGPQGGYLPGSGVQDAAAGFGELRPEFGVDKGFDDGEVGEGQFRSKPRAGWRMAPGADLMEPAGETAEPQPVGFRFRIEAPAAALGKEGEEESSGGILQGGRLGTSLLYTSPSPRDRG